MRELFVDGTFKLCPPLFAQIFVILAKKGPNFVIPILFALLPDKSYPTYQRLFEMIHVAFPQLNPDTIYCDYEIGIHNAIRNGPFNNANVKACFFHLVQNLRTHLSEANLLGVYKANPEFSLLVGFFNNCSVYTILIYIPI